MATVTTNHPVLGVSAAAKRAGVSDARIRQLLAEGTLNGQRLDPNDEASPWLVDLESLDRWAATPQFRGPLRGSHRISK